MRKNSKSSFKDSFSVFGNLKVLICTALMAALSIICGKFLAIPGGNILRFSFENTPILFSSMAFGPIVGAVCGVCADLIGCLIVGYEINPIVTLGAAAIGLFGGVVYKLTEKLPGFVRIILSIIIAHLIGSVVIKTFGLAKFYSINFGILMLWRLLNYVIIAALEIIILCYLFKNKTIVDQIRAITSGKSSVTVNTVKDLRNENTKEMTYNEALDYIHKINWCFCKPGLERITELCKKLGDPQDKLKFIHVAGTNGKGSFCAMISSVLKANGYKVGTYTSPYVKVFNERMAINGQMISNEELAKITEYVKPFADEMSDKPTEFELITAIAFEYFARNNCEYVVLECGLGGRLDSTNVIKTPILSVITGISLDHISILGDTIEKIAFEKAGIIKKGVPCLWCGENEKAEDVIKKVANELEAPFYNVPHRDTKITYMQIDGTKFNFGEYKDVKINLLGEYQPFNATNVLCAIDILKENGIKINEESVLSGLLNVVWHARFEILSDDPLVIADGGHNIEGVTSAVNSIKRYFPNEKLNIVSGVMADKDYDHISDIIGSIASHVFCVTPNNSRALLAEEYSKVYNKKGIPSSAYAKVDDALRAAIQNAKENEKKIICIGSLYMYSEICNFFENNVKKS
ncbi:MAG: folate family ECF transporter S component [Clostridia bacterium]|nr:folate family ECF transporter S component [Clostridia bacterium]